MLGLPPGLGTAPGGEACTECAMATFQVNTPAAEVLYKVIQDWAQLDKESTVLDVCCGTGTIGLALAPVSPPDPAEIALLPHDSH